MGVSVTPQRGIVNAATNVYASIANTATGTNWTQLTASTSAPILVTHVFTQPKYGTAAPSEVYLGTGAALAEVVILTAYASGSSITDTQGATANIYALPFPIRIPAGTRVAMKRGASDSASTLGIVYVNESSVI